MRNDGWHGMTAEQFAVRYCRAIGMTMLDLERLRMGPVPCACGDRDCPGWRMERAVSDAPHEGYNIGALAGAKESGDVR
jgi:hypothetical protein